MNLSSKKTMLTAAVLVTLSSGSAFAATPGTVDSQELFHANRLVTDPANKPAMEENTAPDRYEASISAQKKAAAPAPSMQKEPPAKRPQPARLRWESVDARIAARNNDPSFTLSVQKAKPVIITAEDIRREEKLAAKEGRPAHELVGDVNMHRPAPPPRPKTPAVSAQTQVSAVSGETNAADAASRRQVLVQGSGVSDGMNTIPVSAERKDSVQSMPQTAHPHTASVSDPHSTVQPMRQNHESMAQTASPASEQRPMRPRYPQLPPEVFSLMPPAENGAAQKHPDHFDALGGTPSHKTDAVSIKDRTPAMEHSIRPEGVPEITVPQAPRQTIEDLADLSDEVRRHILAGQLAMEVQLQRDPSVAGMRAITKVLRENTTLTRLQKIDFLIGFGRALHQSGLPRQQEALLIKTIAEAF